MVDFCFLAKERQVWLFFYPLYTGFFTGGSRKGPFFVSTLKIQVAALSLFLDVMLAEELLMKNFLLARPRRTPRLIIHWDLSLVLNALTRAPFEPLNKASLGLVTM